MSPRTKIGALVLSFAGGLAILGYEGYSDQAIQPLPGDKWTIGYGTTEGVKPGDKITPPSALRRAAKDIAKKENAVKKCITAPLYQHEYDAYVSLAYNIGEGAFCSSTLVKKVNQLDYAGGCAEISRWDKFKGKPNKGLAVRRAQERATCEGRNI